MAERSHILVLHILAFIHILLSFSSRSKSPPINTTEIHLTRKLIFYRCFNAYFCFCSNTVTNNSVRFQALSATFYLTGFTLCCFHSDRELKFSFKILLSPFINYQHGMHPIYAGVKGLVVPGWGVSRKGL